MRDQSRSRQPGRPAQPVFLGSLLSELDATSDLPQAFQELRVKFDRVKSHYDSGDLPAERYGDLLASLRCYDSQGTAWTIGASSGLWYRMVDDVWIQWPPPYQDSVAAASAARIYSRAAQASGRTGTPGPMGMPPTAAATQAFEPEAFVPHPPLTTPQMQPPQPLPPQMLPPQTLPPQMGEPLLPPQNFGGYGVPPAELSAFDMSEFAPSEFPLAGGFPPPTPGAAIPADPLLFGLPEQLFAGEAVDPGPVPYGALPETDPFPASPAWREDTEEPSGPYGPYGA
jgi:hypothetical protein